MGRWGAVAVAVLALTVVASCGGEDEPGAEEPATTEQSDEADEGEAASGCQKAPRAVVSAIETALLLRGGELAAAQAVKSEDFESVYFVSAEIQGPGLEDLDVVGTWATNKLEVGGLIYSIDTIAKQFSDWGDGGETDAQLSMEDDGAEESRACVEAG